MIKKSGPWPATLLLILVGFFPYPLGFAQFGPLPLPQSPPAQSTIGNASPSATAQAHLEVPKLEQQVSAIKIEQEQAQILLTSSNLALQSWQSELQQYQSLFQLTQTQFGEHPQTLFIKEDLALMIDELEKRLDQLQAQVVNIKGQGEAQLAEQTKIQQQIDQYKKQLMLDKQKADIQSFSQIGELFLNPKDTESLAVGCYPQYLSLSEELKQSLQLQALQSNITNLNLVPQACFVPSVIKRLKMIAPGHPLFTGEIGNELTKQNSEQLGQPIVDFHQKSTSELFAFYMMGLEGDTHLTKSNVTPKVREFALQASQLIIRQILTELSGEDITSLPVDVFASCLEPQLKIQFPAYVAALDGVMEKNHKKYGLFFIDYYTKEVTVPVEKEKALFFKSKLHKNLTSEQRYRAKRALLELCQVGQPYSEAEKIITPYLTPDVLIQTVLMAQAQDNEGPDSMALGCWLLSKGKLPRDQTKIFPLSSILKSASYAAIGNTTNFTFGNLSAEELAAIRNYTGSGFSWMNRYLWCRDSTPACAVDETKQKSIELVSSGLEDLPPYIGEVYRGMGGSTPATVIGPWLREGQIVANSGFW